jgi:hypothetical protein
MRRVFFLITSGLVLSAHVGHLAVGLASGGFRGLDRVLR